jgi:uncharacterized protein (TIGR02266 family)
MHAHATTNASVPPVLRTQELRRSPRVHVEVELHLQSESNFYVGLTHDVSEGGLFVQTYHLETVGSVVSLELSLPGGYAFYAKGIVRWVRGPGYHDDPQALPPGMGIEFVSLLPEHRALIHEFIENRLPDYFDAE